MHRYHVIVINEKTRRKDYMTAAPVTHEEGCTILRKMVPRPFARYQLEEVTSDDQAPDNRPGFYYVSVIDGGRYILAAGPFENNHAGALACVDTVRKVAQNLDPKAIWYSYGTCRTDTDQGPGRLNHEAGI